MIRILVVDDDPDVAMIMGQVLRRAGFAVFVACGVSEAEVVAPVQWDLIVSDVKMPDGGIEAIKALWPTTPVVAVSGYGDETVDVTKPFMPPEALVQAVRKKLVRKEGP